MQKITIEDMLQVALWTVVPYGLIVVLVVYGCWWLSRKKGKKLTDEWEYYFMQEFYHLRHDINTCGKYDQLPGLENKIDDLYSEYKGKYSGTETFTNKLYGLVSNKAIELEVHA